MLRRKLLLILGSLVGLITVVAVGAIWQLQDVSERLNHVNSQAWGTVERVNALSTSMAEIDVELANLQGGRTSRLDPLLDAVERLRADALALDSMQVVRQPDCEAMYGRLRSALPAFERHVGLLATAQSPELARMHNRAALDSAVELREDILCITRHVRAHAQAEQQALTARFRWVVLGLAAVFLLVINLAAIMMLRMATTVLKPVDRLVAASRELARERFETRVELDQKDEFGELAGALNHLAEQLQQSEGRKMEVLSQVALTMNHELNNAMSIIELQLRLMDRPGEGGPDRERNLRRIRDGLARMATTVRDLKQVRRIVLTDYVAGQKMLDLPRSIEAAPGGDAADGAAGQVVGETVH